MRACMHVLLYAYRSYFSVRAARKRRFPPTLPNTVLPPGRFVVVVVAVLCFVMPSVLRTRAQAPASSTMQLWPHPARPARTSQAMTLAYGCSSGLTAGHGSYGFAPISTSTSQMPLPVHPSCSVHCGGSCGVETFRSARCVYCARGKKAPFLETILST